MKLDVESAMLWVTIGGALDVGLEGFVFYGRGEQGVGLGLVRFVRHSLYCRRRRVDGGIGKGNS